MQAYLGRLTEGVGKAEDEETQAREVQEHAPDGARWGEGRSRHVKF